MNTIKLEEVWKDLLPCPCCGGSPGIYDTGGLKRIQCDDCEIQTRKSGLLEFVVKAWNKRTPATATVHKSDYERLMDKPVHKSINEHINKPTDHKSINEHKPKAKSKAGRKTILTRRLYYDIMQFHNNGRSIRQIIHYIDTFRGEKLSVGFVHKVIKMPPPSEQLEDQLTLDEQEHTA